jgi:glycosyltransferase involved in cell wall biosynthesis
MRILFDARVLKTTLTGVETYTVELLRRLASRAGARVTALCRDTRQAELVRKLTSPDLPVAIARRGMPLRIHHWLRQHGPFDLMHCPTPVFPFLRKPPGLPLVCTVHDVTPRFAPQWHQRSTAIYFRWLLPHLLPLFDHFLADSRATACDLSDWYRIDETRITVVPLASRFSTAAVTATPASLAPKKNIFLAVGTLEPRKNLENTVRGFLEFQRRDPAAGYELVIVGREGWGDCPWKAITTGRSDIRFTGYLNDEELQQLYRTARGLVYPSLYEGFGLPVLEAMSLGCPVVTSHLSSIPEVGGDAVLYVDPLDPKAIADALGRLAHEPDLGDTLGQDGLARAAMFSWERTANETWAAYERAVEAAA